MRSGLFECGGWQRSWAVHNRVSVRRSPSFGSSRAAGGLCLLRMGHLAEVDSVEFRSGQVRSDLLILHMTTSQYTWTMVEEPT